MKLGRKQFPFANFVPPGGYRSDGNRIDPDDYLSELK